MNRITRLFCLIGIFSISLPVWADEPEVKSFDDFFLEGLRLKLRGDHQPALDAFEKALEIDSTSSAALFEVSNYYIFTQQTEKALEPLQKAVGYNPENTHYKLSLANLYRNIQRFDDAIPLYEELAKENPDNPEIHFYLSDLYLRTYQVQKAIESLNNLENNIGINEMISMQKYQLYRILEENDNALSEVKKLSEKFPAEPRYIIIMGDFYLEFQKPDKALEYYEKARKLDSNNPYYFISMANYYDQKGDKEGLFKEIENALKTPSMEMESKIDILVKYIQMVLQEKGDQSKIISLIETLIELHPQEKEINMIYGEFLISQEKAEDAKFQFQLVTEAEPENQKAWTQLLLIAVAENNTNDIIAISKDALLHFPESAEFYFYLGIAYLEQEDLTSALNTLQSGLQYIPETNKKVISEFYGLIGDLHHQLEDKEQAYKAYEKALEYNENNIMVLNNYAYFLSLDKQDLDKAERMSARTVQLEPNNPTYIDTYAWVFYQKGNYSLAKFYIESAINKPGARDREEIMKHYHEILEKYEENK